MRILDGSYNDILDSKFDSVVSSKEEGSPQFTTSEENFIKNTKIDSKFDLARTKQLTELITLSGLDKSKFKTLSPCFNKAPGSTLKQLYGSAGIAPSGDYTESYLGLECNGTNGFDLKINPSTDISDFNNWSFGFSITVDNDAGTDIGCSDGTNAVTVAANNGGALTVQIGTATDTFANTGTGHYMVNISGGEFTLYKDLDSTNSTATSVAGSAPNLDMFLGCYNLSSSETDLTTNTYSMVWVYDSDMSLTQMISWHSVVFNFENLSQR